VRTVQVSVIIVSLNKKRQLNECLDSVFNQDYDDIEIIVIDNGSFVPGMREMLKRYSGKIILIENNRNLGACKARNQGIKIAHGKYILFLDDDSILLDRDTITRAVERMENNPQIGILGGIHYADREKRKVYLYQCITGFDGFLDRKASTQQIREFGLDKNIHIPTCFAMVRKDIVKSIGGFDTFFYYYEEDNDLSMRVRKKGYLIAVDPQLSVYHISGQRERKSHYKYRNKTYLILKDYSFKFKIAFGFTLFKKLLCSNSLDKLIDTMVRMGFFFYYIFMYPLILYRKRIDFLKDKSSWLDKFSVNILDLFPNLIETSLKIKNKLMPSNNKHLFLFVTNNCNARCVHCFYWRHINIENNEMNLDEYIKLARLLQKRINRVVITGGEPFLRDDLVEICKVFLRDKRIRVINIITNGFLTEKIYRDMKDILKTSSLRTRVLICISLDGFEKTHDRIRNVSGLFNKAIRTIYSLKSLQKDYPNLEVSVVTTILKDNCHEIREFNKFVENQLGVYHRINLVRSSNINVFGVERELVSDFSLPKNSEVILEIGEIEDICNYFFNKDNFREYHKMILLYSLYILKYKRKFFECNAPQVNIVVYPNADISFCELLKPVGNLRTNRFKFYKLWHSKKNNQLREKLKNCVCTHPCNLGENLIENPQLQGILPQWFWDYERKKKVG
jgi:GT2 family glycosyltransferase